MIKGSCEINEKSIIYNKESRWIHEPAWEIALICSDLKDVFIDDNAMWLVISDRKEELACILGTHGGAFKKYGSKY